MNGTGGCDRCGFAEEPRWRKSLRDAGSDVRLWVRRPELAEAIATSQINADYLPNISLPESIATTTDAQRSLARGRYRGLCCAFTGVRVNLANWNADLPADATLVSISKVSRKTF